jgi:predicted MFS family arabinose efflux permease
MSTLASSATAGDPSASGMDRRQPRYRWIILGAATCAQLSACFLVQGLGALAGYMQHDLALDAAQVGMLISAAQLVPIAGLLVVGELLDRIGERFVIGAGIAIVSLGLWAASLSDSYVGLLACLVLVGAGYSTVQPGGSKLVAGWFSTSQRGLAMGVRQAGLPIGGALAAAILPSVASAYGWRAAFVVGACFAAAGGIVVVALCRPRAIASADRDHDDGIASSRRSILKRPAMPGIIVSGITLITVQYALLVYAVLHLRDEVGTSLATGGWLLLVALTSGAVGRVALAAWSDRRIGGRHSALLVCMVALVVGIAGLLVIRTDSFLALAGVLAWLGFFGYGWYGPWVAAVTEACDPNRVGLSLGLVMGFNQVAIVVTPPALGLLRDTTGGYGFGWMILIATLATMVIVMVMLRPVGDTDRLFNER